LGWISIRGKGLICGVLLKFQPDLSSSVPGKSPEKAFAAMEVRGTRNPDPTVGGAGENIMIQ